MDRKILVVDDEGNKLGEMSVQEGIKLSEEKGLDLVCVAPNAPKPVCRMMDYRKFRYEQQKRARVAKKNQTIEVNAPAGIMKYKILSIKK